MKTTTETKTETIQKTIYHYGCDFCSFTSTSEGTTKEHIANAHGCMEKKEINGEEFFRFDSEEGYRNFIKNSRYSFGAWWGPGWYGIRYEDDYCMGSYMGQNSCLYHCEYLRNEAKDERKAINQKIAAFEALLPKSEAPECLHCHLPLTDPADINAPGIPRHTYESECISELRNIIEELTK